MPVDSISGTKVVQPLQPLQRKAEQEMQTAGNKEKREPAKDLDLKDKAPKETPTVGEVELIDAIEKANKAVQGINKRFEYSIHEKTHTIMVKVINSDNDEVIQEIPSEKILNMVAKIWEMAGLFVDERI